MTSSSRPANPAFTGCWPGGYDVTGSRHAATRRHLPAGRSAARETAASDATRRRARLPVMPVSRRKLVRDKIPEIIQAGGGHPVTRILDDAGYRQALLAKLAEEAAEAAQASTGDLPGELADVLEVLRALAAAAGMSWEQLLAWPTISATAAAASPARSSSNQSNETAPRAARQQTSQPMAAPDALCRRSDVRSAVRLRRAGCRHAGVHAHGASRQRRAGVHPRASVAPAAVLRGAACTRPRAPVL